MLLLIIMDIFCSYEYKKEKINENKKRVLSKPGYITDKIINAPQNTPTHRIPTKIRIFQSLRETYTKPTAVNDTLSHNLPKHTNSHSTRRNHDDSV